MSEERLSGSGEHITAGGEHVTAGGEHVIAGGEQSVARTLGELFQYRVRQSPDAIGFRFEDESFTNADMARLVDRVRASLQRDGISRGDRVAAFTHNSPFMLALFMACAVEGFVFCPVNVQYRKKDLAYTLADLAAAVLFIDPELQATFEGVREESAVPIVVFSSADALATAGIQSLGGWLVDQVPKPPSEPIGPGDPLCIIYSGGTTGLPKGIVIPQFAPVHAGIRYNSIARFSEHEVYFSVLQMSHAFTPLIALPFCLTYGHTLCFWKWWSASRFIERMRQYRATITDIFIGMIATLLRTPQRADDAQFQHVRVIAGLGGLDAVAMRLRSEFCARFGCMTFDLYGFAESNGLVAFERESEERRTGSCGTPSRWFDVRVVGPDDAPLPPGVAGEVLVRPRVPNTIGLGYHNKAELTVRTWRNLWIHTGDLAYLDEDGYLFYVGRRNHFLRRRGEMVAGAEIEGELMGHPGVVEVAVVAAPSDFGEDEIRACVVFKEGACHPQMLVDYLRERLAAFKVPRYFDVYDELPRTGAKREIEKFRLQARDLSAAWDSTQPDRLPPEWESSLGLKRR